MTKFDFEINCLGQKCPLPVTRLERAFGKGYKDIRLIADDPISKIDVPVAVNRLGGSYAQADQDGAIVFEINFA